MRPRHAAALCKSDPAILTSMINAAFRLPDLSTRYLYDRILEADAAGKTLSSDAFNDEIAFRERSHNISKHSAYACVTSTFSGGIPPNDADTVPPLVSSIQPATIASFPLKYSHAEAYLGEGAGSRTVLVGDAAHTIHPLAGQGLNLGLGDVECLARCITQTLKHGGDIGQSYPLALLRQLIFDMSKALTPLSVPTRANATLKTTRSCLQWTNSTSCTRRHSNPLSGHVLWALRC